jgi:hypothetical protein
VIDVITWLRARLREDSGIGMILVIGIVIFVAGITVTAAVIAENGLGQTRKRVSFERSLAAAESGIDFALGHLQHAFDTASADYPIPAGAGVPTAGCTANVVDLPDLTAVDEQTWAEAKLADIATNHPNCIMDTPNGDVVVLKPRNPVGGAGVQYGRVYARGWSPGIGERDVSSRTIKVEYVFTPYKPQFAILTGQSLHLQSSSTDVMGAHNVPPQMAAVHTNGNLTTTGQPTVTGPVSFGGTGSGSFGNFMGGTATKKAPVRMPRVSAVAFYRQAQSLHPAALSTWTDLCPDGSAKAYAGGAGPCTGTVLKAQSPYNGWSYNSGQRRWTASKDTTPGTYFVHQANVANGNGNGAIANITVIASATSSDCATKQYGNITWDHYDTPAWAFKNLFFLADGDLSATSNFYSGQSSASLVVSGMYIAGEEVEVWTSSSGLVGSVLAANQCGSDSGPVSSNEVQGQVIKFDPNGDSPFSSLIATTLWLEY